MMDSRERHTRAWNDPRGFERPIVAMYTALNHYAMTHQAKYSSPIGEDGVLGDYWRDMAQALIGLLNGETGRLDCGYLDSSIRALAKEHGVDLDQ